MVSVSSVKYEITGGNTGDIFEIDPHTGDISLTHPLDYETKKKVCFPLFKYKFEIVTEQKIKQSITLIGR